MTLTWTAFQAALDGAPDPSGAIDALTASSALDLPAMLDRIGAAEAGRLLTEALTADREARLATLAASLDIIESHLPAGRVSKPSIFSRRSAWTGAAPTADSVRSALVASLIDAALGGDPEQLRTRITVVATQWETAVQPELKGLSKADRDAETSAARHVLQAVIKLLLADIQSRERA